MERNARQAPGLTELPLVLSHNPAITFAQLKAEIRRQVRRKAWAWWCSTTSSSSRTPSPNRPTPANAEVALMTRGLKVLAQQMEIPIVVLCQLNRDSAKREDTRPKVHELRRAAPWNRTRTW
ncbi:DnaB-like helicase C-terminal domain-containing protein (plasmid) [Nocardiopsis sp. LDBS0036]